MSAGRGAPGVTDRTISASGWRFATVGVQVLLQLLVLSILSRLVPPEDFGVLAIAMIFVNLATLLSDLGTGAALIQREDLNARHIRTAFTLSLAVGAMLAAVLGFGASLWAALFDSDQVAPVLRLISVSFLLTAGGLVPNALLWRGMRMRALGAAEICSYVAGYGLVGVLLAFEGYGIWALAWAVVVQSAVRTALLVWLSPHSFVPGMWREETGQILGYGLGLSLTRLLNFAATKGDYVVVGRWLGTEALGLYERAYRLMEMPATYLAGVMGRVLFPALSEVQADPARLRRGFMATLSAVVLLYTPAAVLLWVAAPSLIPTLFGPAWEGSVLPLRILSIGLVFRGAYKICDALIRATGAVYRSAWRVMVYAMAVLGGAWLGKRWGIAGVATFVTIAIVLKYALVAHLCSRLVGLRWAALARSHAPGLALGGIVGVVSWCTDLWLAEQGVEGWPRLAIVATATLAATPVGLALIPRSWIGEELRLLTARLEGRLPALGRLADYLLSGRKGKFENNGRH